jgi:multidrug efflux pump subunit AcrA (membrane-fusion protein)
MGDDLGRRLTELLERLEKGLTKAEAQLAAAIAAENLRLADVEARLRLLEARDSGDDEQRLDYDDLDLRVTVLDRAVERLEAKVMMLTGTASSGPAQDSAPTTFDPPIEPRGDTAD